MLVLGQPARQLAVYDKVGADGRQTLVCAAREISKPSKINCTKSTRVRQSTHMSYKRAPLFRFMPMREHSPPRTPRKNPLRKRASTGDRLTGMKLVDSSGAKRIDRVVHYMIYMRNTDWPRLQERIFNEMRHSEEIDDAYESICVTLGAVEHKQATCVLVLDIVVAPDKKWLSTGSDVYLHYLVQLRKCDADIVQTSVESASHVMDRIAAHSDYTLLRNLKNSK
jgi:hypothetical protein